MHEAILQCVGVSALLLAAFLLGVAVGTRHARDRQNSKTIAVGYVPIRRDYLGNPISPGRGGQFVLIESPEQAYCQAKNLKCLEVVSASVVLE